MTDPSDFEAQYLELLEKYTALVNKTHGLELELVNERFSHQQSRERILHLTNHLTSMTSRIQSLGSSKSEVSDNTLLAFEELVALDRELPNKILRVYPHLGSHSGPFQDSSSTLHSMWVRLDPRDWIGFRQSIELVIASPDPQRDVRRVLTQYHLGRVFY